MIDIKHWQFIETSFDQEFQRFGGNLIARLGKDFTGRRVIKIRGNILPVEILVLRAQKLLPAFGKQTGGAHSQFLASFKDDFAGVGVENVESGLHALHALGLEWKPPAVLVPFVSDGLVKNRENLLAIHT